MVKVYGPNDMSMDDYKKEVITNQGILCPVTLEPVDMHEGEIIYHEGKDWFISKVGLGILRQMFGAEYIDDKIIRLGSSL